MKINGEKRRLFPRAILLLGGVAILGWVALEILRVGPPPEIGIRPAIPVIGKRTSVAVDISEPKRGLSRVQVDFVQGDKIQKLAEKQYQYAPVLAFWTAHTDRDTLDIVVGRETIDGLKAGQATIRVTADRTPTRLRHPAPASQEITLPVRLSPPSLQVMSTKTYVSQGGCETVVYRVGESSVLDGVRAGSWWFPGYPLPGGGKGDRFAFFAIPYDMNSADARLVAADEAENQTEVAFIDQFFAKKFKEDGVDVSDAFIGKVVPEIMGQTPEFKDRGSPLDNYLGINTELRRVNAETIKELARRSRQEFLWSKPFLAMRNGQVMAGFADYRTYSHHGKIVDHQTHLGYDLAVTRHAPVPAANDGIVVYAGYLGIYGNCVVIDHGYGIQSLYGHLSSIAVKEDQKIARGEAVGQTGETGLAGGDHLHYAVILAGLPVDPVEWWDGHWIQDRIALKLGPGFKYSE